SRAALARDDGEQLLLAAVGGIAGVRRHNRRRFVYAGREVGEEPLDHRRRLFFRLGEIVNGAVAAVDMPAAQLFLGNVVAHRVSYDRRSGHELLSYVAHHHREMAEHGLRGANTNYATEQYIDYRHLAKLSHVHCASEMARQERPAPARDARPTGHDRAKTFLCLALAGRPLPRHHRGHAAAA